MVYKEFQDSVHHFSEMVFMLNNSTMKEKVAKQFIKQYVEQNIILLNQILKICTQQFKVLQKISSPEELIFIQAKLTEEINYKITQSMHHFLNVSLNQIAHYNAWLKEQCELMTD